MHQHFNKLTLKGDGSMSNSLEDKVIVITGAASGFGKASAIRAAQEGARALALIDKDDLTETAKEIGSYGTETLSFSHTDVTDEKQIKIAFRAVGDAYQTIDVVYSNAGILGRVSPIEDFAENDWTKTINTNINGGFHVVQAAIPYMKENGGSIIVTASVSGVRQFSQLGFTAYSTSKAAITAFARMAAYELSQYNIRVNSINPGASETNIFDSGSFSEQLDKLTPVHEVPELAIPLGEKKNQADAIANTFAFLASDAAKRITGAQIVVDGGETLLKG
ncbi:3-oxoacyl-[acyl-carrier-protein] reductase [Tetragenococcus koreensis]|nr:3-oxoacyl-[acyl-carrier-protein] reductase [Tetragenococcus koreensis]